jgi:hypothetical protein
MTIQDPNVVRATRIGKILAAILLVVGIGLLALFQFYLTPLLKAVLGLSPPINGMRIVKTIFISLSVSGMASGLVMAWYGRKIRRCGQCPPPDAWLARDTRVRRGKSAINIAWIYIGGGTLIGIMCIVLGVYVATKLEPSVRYYPVRPGTIILQPQHPGKP